MEAAGIEAAAWHSNRVSAAPLQPTRTLSTWRTRASRKGGRRLVGDEVPERVLCPLLGMPGMGKLREVSKNSLQPLEDDPVQFQAAHRVHQALIGDDGH